jgi:glycosyltransferase involved in cell wall biosynthesis
MKTCNSLPKICIVLYAFNERKFIEAAITSMFKQDYQNLEIVLSDDGSTDGTYEVMVEMANIYQGPHRVLLNRNPQNLGIGSQINAAVAMTTGQIIILANADDVSHSDRVTQSVQAWLSASPRPTAVWSALQQIDEDGRPLARIMNMQVDALTLARGMQNRFSGGGAASLALDRRVFSAFGPLPDNLILEDSPLFARAMLLGTVQYLPDPLVDYRVHPNNISQSYALTDFEEWSKRNMGKLVWHKHEGIKAYLQILRDMYQKPAESCNSADLALARWIGMEKLLENSIMHDYYAKDSTITTGLRLRTLLRLSVLLMKTRVKQLLPFIERRNARWQYERTVSAAKGEL